MKPGTNHGVHVEAEEFDTSVRQTERVHLIITPIPVQESGSVVHHNELFPFIDIFLLHFLLLDFQSGVIEGLCLRESEGAKAQSE